MKMLGTILQTGRRASIALAVFAIIAPQMASAHGELLIQIAAATKQIESATENPARLYLHRAELHREHQDWDSAKSDYDRAAELDPNLVAVDFCRAKMLDDAGQFEAARMTFDKVISLSPKQSEAFIGRARVLVKLGDRKSAIADFRQGLDLSKDPKPEYYLDLARCLVSETDTNGALRSLDEGIRKFGPIVTLQHYALELELARKDSAAAVARLDTIIQRAERKETWLARRGEILIEMGRLDEAQESLDAALAAIKRLPSVLQKASPMQSLQSRIRAASGKIAAPSVTQNLQ